MELSKYGRKRLLLCVFHLIKTKRMKLGFNVVSRNWWVQPTAAGSFRSLEERCAAVHPEPKLCSQTC